MSEPMLLNPDALAAIIGPHDGAHKKIWRALRDQLGWNGAAFDADKVRRIADPKKLVSTIVHSDFEEETPPEEAPTLESTLTPEQIEVWRQITFAGKLPSSAEAEQNLAPSTPTAPTEMFRPERAASTSISSKSLARQKVPTQKLSKAPFPTFRHT